MMYSSLVNKEQHDKIAQRVEQLKDAEPGTKEAKELKALTQILVQFEAKRARVYAEALRNGYAFATSGEQKD